MGFSKRWSGKLWSPRRDRPVSLFPFHREGDGGGGRQRLRGHTVQQQGCTGGPRVLLSGAFALIPGFGSLLREMKVHPGCSCAGHLEADLSGSGMAFRSPKSQVFLFTKLSCASRSESITQEMWLFSPDASSTGHISLSCRLSLPEAEYRSWNDRLGKDGLFLVTSVQCSSVQKSLSWMESSKPASGPASLKHFSPVPRLTQSWCFHTLN